MSTVRLTGKTYDIRDYLRAAGATWDPSDKSWTIDSARWEELLAVHGGDASCGNKRDRALKAAFAAVTVTVACLHCGADLPSYETGGQYCDDDCAQAYEDS